MANRTRNIVLRVPVTAEERALIEKKMQQMGTRCFSVYARKMLIDGYVIKLDYSDIKVLSSPTITRKFAGFVRVSNRYGNMRIPSLPDGSLTVGVWKQTKQTTACRSSSTASRTKGRGTS